MNYKLKFLKNGISFIVSIKFYYIVGAGGNSEDGVTWTGGVEVTIGIWDGSVDVMIGV